MNKLNITKNLVTLFALLALGISTFVSVGLVKAQLNQPTNQLYPMSTPSPSLPPAKNPDSNNLPNILKAPAPTPLPLPKDLSADIGESAAVQIALKTVDGNFGESNPQVISANLMTYKEGMLLSPEPTSVPEEDPRSKMLVRVVKMEGAFQPRSAPFGVTPQTYTKALIVIRAPDGLVLRSSLSFE